jgi:tRNA(Ile2) C34 agmatinyltransferase TiaS
MYTNSRDTEVQLLKKLWNRERVICPKCGGGTLEYLHRGAKKSDCDWKCPACGEIFRTIRMLKELPFK